jgi:plastocyanin
LRVTKDNDRGCGAPEQPSERLVVDAATGGVGNALVLLSGIRRGKDWPEEMRDAGRTAVLDQRGCRYVPHVFWARPDTQLVIVNSDRADHNIHAYRDSMRDTAFNISSEPGTRKDQNETAFLEQTGTYILKCDIHPWMSGYLHVLPHPYAAVTQAVARDGLAPGEFLLTDVPPGTYDLLVWKEGQVETPMVAEGKIVAYNYSPDFTETRKVTVEAGGTVTLEIVLPVR